MSCHDYYPTLACHSPRTRSVISTVHPWSKTLERWSISSQTSIAYILFISITISNGCGSTLLATAASTAAVDQNKLSSIDGSGKTQSYNLADLPCPPANVSVPPGQQYQPSIAWQGQFSNFALPTIASECKYLEGQAGILDPPKAFPTVPGGLRGPGPPGGHRPSRLKREPAKALVAPWMPARTPTATWQARFGEGTNMDISVAFGFIFSLLWSIGRDWFTCQSARI